MDDRPELSDCENDPDEWLSHIYLFYSAELAKLRACGDEAGLEVLVEKLAEDIALGRSLGGDAYLSIVTLAEFTRDPEKRMERLLTGYAMAIAELDDYQDFENQMHSCFEAATMMREIAVLHEKRGDLAAARKCYEESMERNAQAGDFAYTFCAQGVNTRDEDAYPLRLRLLEDLKRMRAGE